MTDSAAPYPAPRSAAFALTVTASLYFFVALDTGLTGLLLEPMKHDMGLSDIQVAFANSTAMLLSYGVLSIPMGMLTDRVSRTRLLLAATVVWMAAMVLAGLSHTIFWLVVSRIGLGAANAIIYPAGLSLLADNFQPDRRGSATGVLAGSKVIGQAAAVLVACTN